MADDGLFEEPAFEVPDAPAASTLVDTGEIGPTGRPLPVFPPPQPPREGPRRAVIV